MPKYCEKCGAANDDAALFCFKCSSYFSSMMNAGYQPDISGAKICRRCSSPIPANFKFCSVCGETADSNASSAQDTAALSYSGIPASVKVCPSCSTQIPIDAAVCNKCGLHFSVSGGTGSGGGNKRSAIPIVIVMVVFAVLALVGGAFSIAAFTDIKVPVVSIILDALDSKKDSSSDKNTEKTTENDKDSDEDDEKNSDDDEDEEDTEDEDENFDISLEQGAIIEFGSYPQSVVKSSKVISALEELAEDKEWESYNYTSGTGYKGTMKKGSWMKFIDIEYNGDKYRGVYFTQYRPHWCYLSSSASNSEQDNNGYKTDTYYWFKYEPLSWIVLDEKNGLVMSECAIDSQPHVQYIYQAGYEVYNNKACSRYASDYESSYLRKWLNENFYYTAFSYNERDHIMSNNWNNAASSSAFSRYGSSTTTDYISVLSYKEALNSSYGFSASASARDSFRLCYGTDYAESQGLMVSDSGRCSNLHLRSPGSGSDFTAGINTGGDVYHDGLVESTRVGVRPIMYVDFN